LKDTFKEV